MTPDLLALAIRAIDDPDAQCVLEDACLERGVEYSVDIDAGALVRNVSGAVVGRGLGRVVVVVDGRAFRWTYQHPTEGAGSPTMRALVAALLFGEWSEWAWPLVRSTVLSSMPPTSGTAEHFRWLVRTAAAVHGYPGVGVSILSGNAHRGPGTVRAHLDAPIPDGVLEVMWQEIVALIPAHVLLDLTAEPFPG